MWIYDIYIYIGVESVTFEREERDRVVIKGEEVDAAGVTECLRDKVSRHARLVSVANLND